MKYMMKVASLRGAVKRVRSFGFRVPEYRFLK